MYSKRIEVSIKEITDKSESKKMEVSTSPWRAWASEHNADTRHRSCKYRMQCNSSSSNKRLLPEKVKHFWLTNLECCRMVSVFLPELWESSSSGDPIASHRQPI
jgi:hypothetical protein